MLLYIPPHFYMLTCTNHLSFSVFVTLSFAQTHILILQSRVMYKPMLTDKWHTHSEGGGSITSYQHHRMRHARKISSILLVPCVLSDTIQV